MADELVFYTHPMSRARVVRWMLEEVGCPYRAEVLEYGPAMKSPAYLAVNPRGKVPAIRHGDVVVTGLWSHFACADDPDHPANARQQEAFAEACALAVDADLLGDTGTAAAWRHLGLERAPSGALFDDDV